MREAPLTHKLIAGMLGVMIAMFSFWNVRLDNRIGDLEKGQQEILSIVSFGKGKREALTDQVNKMDARLTDLERLHTVRPPVGIIGP